MTVEDWLRAAMADAERRGLEALKPILEGLARSTTALREAERTIAPASRLTAGADADR
jgi:hypothetical protein